MCTLRLIYFACSFNHSAKCIMHLLCAEYVHSAVMITDEKVPDLMEILFLLEWTANSTNHRSVRWWVMNALKRLKAEHCEWESLGCLYMEGLEKAPLRSQATMSGKNILGRSSSESKRLPAGTSLTHSEKANWIGAYSTKAKWAVSRIWVGGRAQSGWGQPKDNFNEATSKH